MKKYIFTDLACEMSNESVAKKESLGENIDKVVYDSDASLKEKRITFFTPRLWLLSDSDFCILSNGIAYELKVFAKKINPRGACLRILVVGIGNPCLTSDALGPNTVKGIYVTPPSGRSPVKIAAIVPDVAGNTGVETIDTVRAYVKIIRPDIVIAIDSLRARSYERLASTVQLSYSGIVPGSGIGNSGEKINGESIGTPVISIGIPTVISSSTLIYETLERCGAELENEELITLLENNLNYFVSPKEVDLLVKSASLLLSAAINSAFCDQ